MATHQSDDDDCVGSDAEMPMIKNSTTAKEIPKRTIVRRPIRAMAHSVRMLEKMDMAIPISIIMAVLVDDRPARTMKYGALLIKVAPTI